MSIRPVDMQVLIPKASEIGRTYDLNNSEQNLAAQQSFKNEVDKQYDDLSNTVMDSNKSENLVDEDGSNKSKERRERQNRRKKENKKDEIKKDRFQPGMFNIQV